MARPTMKALAAADMDLLFNPTLTPWEESAIYTPRGGTPIEVSCFLSGDQDTFSRMEDYERGENTAEIYVWLRKSDIAEPKWRDKLTLRGEDWYFGVFGVVKEDAYSLKIHWERDLTCDEG